MALTKVSSAGLNINAGLPFPATAVAVADANTLDDYEEGTWDAVVTDGTNPMTMSGSYDTGYYTKVGNLVHVSGFFVTTSLGSASGDIKMTGLPFTVADNAAGHAGGAAPHGDNLGIDPIYSVTYFGAIGDTYIHLRVWDVTSGTSTMQASEWSANGQLIISFTYRAA